MMSLFQLLGKLTLRNVVHATKSKAMNDRRRHVPLIEVLETRLAPATTITVLGSGVGSLDTILAAHHGIITTTDGASSGNQAETLSAAALKAVGSATNISITARTSITFNDLGGTLTLQTGAGKSVTFSVSGPSAAAISFSNTVNQLATSGGTIDLVAGSDLTLANLSAAGGDINLVAGTSSHGSVSARNVLTSGNGNVTVQATNAAAPSTITQFGLLTGHSVNITASGSVVVDQVNSGSITLTSNTGSITSAGAHAIQSSGLLTLNAVTGITVNSQAAKLQALNSASGNIVVTQTATPLATGGTGIVNNSPGGSISVDNLGGAITVAAGAPIASVNGPITLDATDFTILNSIASGLAATTLGNAKAGTPIDIGTNNVLGKISLTQAELQFITAAFLRVGSPTAGPVTISRPVVVPAGVNGNLHLMNNGAITESTTPSVGSLIANNLAISSQGPVALSNVNNLGALASATTGAFLVNNGTNGLLIGTVDGLAGVSTTNNNITLEADNINISQAVSPGPSSNTTNTVLLEPFTHNLNITIGTSSIAGSTFGLTNNNLGWITSGITKIGVSADTGSIAITAAINRTPNGSSRSQTLVLITGNTSFNPLTGSATGAITQAVSASLSVANLAVQSVGGVQLNSAFNNVNTIAGIVTGTNMANNFRFVDSPAGALTIGAVAGLSGITNTKGNFLEVSTNGGLVINTGLHGKVLGVNAGAGVSEGSGAGAVITGGTLLALGAGPYVLLSAKNNVGTLLANVTNAFIYNNAGNLAIGSIFINFADGFGGASGISATSGPVDVITVNGNVTVNDAVTAGAGNPVILTAGNTGLAHNTLTNNSTITGGTATFNADRMVLGGGAVNVGVNPTNIITLQPVSAGWAIDLGDTGDLAAVMQLSQIELATLTSGILRIGGTIAGNVTFTAPINGVGHFASLSLFTHGVIAQTGAGAVTVANLSTIGVGGVALATNPNTVSTNFAGAATNMSLAFVNSTAITIGAVDTQDGINVGTGGVSLRAIGSAILNGLPAGNDVTAGSVAFNGTGGIATLAKPLTLAVNKVSLISNAPAFLSETGTATIFGAGLNAGSSAITLTSGTFTFSANNQIPATSAVSLIGATLNLGAFHDTIASLAMSATSALDVRLNAFSAGSFGSLTVNGAINLGGAALNLTLAAGFVKPAVGKSIVLIRNVSNVAVTGQFAGLGEGATITIDAVKFRISFLGGAGHDVTLTSI